MEEVSCATMAHLIVYGTLIGLIALKQLNVGKAGEGEYDYPDLLKDFLGMVQSSYKNDTRIDEIL